MRIAVCQFAAGTDVAENTRTCVALIGRAAEQGADLAGLPEASMYFDPKHTDGPGPHGQRLDGPFAAAIADAASSGGIAVLAGMLETAVGDTAGDTDAPDGAARDFNTLIAISARGERIGQYRKIHLYDAFGFRESNLYLAGAIEAPLLFDVAGVTVGALTCYDLRFPEAFRWVVDAGADVVALPAAWIAGPAKEQHWATLLAARAIENTVYVAGAGQTGPVCCGQSMIVDPAGAVVAGAGAAPGIAIADIDPQRVAAVRATNPSLANRRFTVMPVIPAAAR